jgi:hypothetical protein
MVWRQTTNFVGEPVTGDFAAGVSSHASAAYFDHAHAASSAREEGSLPAFQRFRGKPLDEKA